jgi:hypothetical protein
MTCAGTALLVNMGRREFHDRHQGRARSVTYHGVSPDVCAAQLASVTTSQWPWIPPQGLRRSMMGDTLARASHLTS